MVQTKSPANSRGVSPARRNNAGPTNGNLNKVNKAGPTRRSQSLTRKNNNNNNNVNRSRGVSPARSLNGSTKAKTPTHNNNQPVLVRSRGSEFGSMDFLESMTQSSGSTEPSTPGDNINVVVRVRPLSDKEIREGDEMVVQFPGNGQLLCEAQNNGSKSAQSPKQFSYNVVFEPGATQDDIVQYSGIKRLIEMAIEGFSCTAFCYGQTGSGKTHTLTGPPELFIGKPNLNHEFHGLVFRSFLYLFQQIKSRTDMNFVLQASFLEIYNEKVIDLLNPGTARKPLAVRWSKKSRGFFVENLFVVDCEELDDLLAVLEEGMRNRSIGSHHMNEHSSRSHTILTVHITSEQQAENGVYLSKQGKINFVDLAGSEMSKKTHSEGKTLEEANNINKSLMVLGYCIAQLSDNKKKSGHIPYRDSKLTKLLADSLAGNGVTLMIACISPARSNLTETINTLRYAARAKKIRTKPVIMMDPREALILSLKREVVNLTLENEHLKNALHLHSDSAEIIPHINSEPPRPITPAPKVDLEQLAELEGTKLADLIKLYIKENEALRTENSELYSSREMVLRDQEIVCRENERLLKKLEDVNSSPIIESQGTFKDELGRDPQSEMWRNPINGSTDSVADQSKYRSTEHLSGRVSANEYRIPEDLQKELDRRRIGDSITQIANSIRRHNSDHSITGPKSRGSSGTVKKMSPNSAEHRAARRTEPLIKSRPPSSTLVRAISDVRPIVRPKSKTLIRAKSDTNQDSLLRSKMFGSTVSLIDDPNDAFSKVTTR